jgi:CTP-dependent riboflavin kinase
MMIEVTNDDDLITLACSKSKETEGFDDRHLARITIETRPGETSCVWVPTEKVAHRTADKLSRQQREVLEMLNAPLFVTVGARFGQLADALPNFSRSGLYKILNRLMDAPVGYITQGKKGEPFVITDAGKAALSTAENGSRSGKSTVSTPSLPMSPETPSLQSTLSTPPTGGRQRLDVDSGGQAETAPAESKTELPPLSDIERTTLNAWADYARQAPSSFVSPYQVFSRPDPVRLRCLDNLQTKGYLEQVTPPGQGYRLTQAGWAVLGLRLGKLDLTNF